MSKKLKNICITRSKIQFIRKSIFVFSFCLVLSVITYCFIDKIVLSVQEYSYKLFNSTSNFLIDKGFVADKIVIKGNKIVRNADIIKLIERHKPILFISLNKLKERILKENKWVKSVKIKRLLPDSLYIDIQEYIPFANWYYQSQRAVIDKSGHVIAENYEKKDLISIHGDDALSNLQFLQEILDSDNELKNLISSFFRVSNRRWNILFNTGLEVKLPENDPYKAWNYLLHLHRTSPEFLNWRVIDMRISNKIFIKK